MTSHVVADGKQLPKRLGRVGDVIITGHNLPAGAYSSIEMAEVLMARMGRGAEVWACWLEDSPSG